MHARTYTCLCFYSTGSVYRSDYINLREGERRTNSVKDRLHTQRNDWPSTHTCVLIFWSSCDEKLSQTHLGKQLLARGGEAKADESIKLQQLNDGQKVRVCVFTRVREGVQNEVERKGKLCFGFRESVCMYVCM